MTTKDDNLIKRCGINIDTVNSLNITAGSLHMPVQRKPKMATVYTKNPIEGDGYRDDTAVGLKLSDKPGNALSIEDDGLYTTSKIKFFNATSESEDSVADGDGAIAIGGAAKAPAGGAIAIGNYTEAKGPESMAIGYRASAEHYNAVALGANSATHLDDSVSVGNVDANILRRITGVEDGVDPNDAVTYKQVETLEHVIGDSYIQLAKNINAIAKEYNTLVGILANRGLINADDGYHELELMQINEPTEE